MSENSYVIPTSRLESLTDGIFAVAMTILVLSLNVPTIDQVGRLGIYGFLVDVLPQLSIYFISFVLLGSFWIAHHVFYSIKHMNQTVIWINVLWLMFICLVPFSVSLVGDFPYSIIAEIFFGLNIILIAILHYINIFYAFKKGFLDPKSVPDIKKISLDPLFCILVLILAIIGSIMIPLFSRVFYLLVPIFLIVPSKQFIKWKHKQ